jgi:hypothetical protein
VSPIRADAAEEEREDGVAARPASRAGGGAPGKEEQIRWVLDTFKVALRLLGITNREVETRNGWSFGYLSRVFGGTIELRFEHILAIADTAGLSPAEFFHLAYPALPEPLPPATDRLFQILRRFRASG